MYSHDFLLHLLCSESCTFWHPYPYATHNAQHNNAAPPQLQSQPVPEIVWMQWVRNIFCFAWFLPPRNIGQSHRKHFNIFTNYELIALFLDSFIQTRIIEKVSTCPKRIYSAFDIVNDKVCHMPHFSVWYDTVSTTLRLNSTALDVL